MFDTLTKPVTINEHDEKTFFLSFSSLLSIFFSHLLRLKRMKRKEDVKEEKDVTFPRGWKKMMEFLSFSLSLFLFHSVQTGWERKCQKKILAKGTNGRERESKWLFVTVLETRNLFLSLFLSLYLYTQIDSMHKLHTATCDWIFSSLLSLFHTLFPFIFFLLLSFFSFLSYLK